MATSYPRESGRWRILRNITARPRQRAPDSVADSGFVLVDTLAQGLETSLDGPDEAFSADVRTCPRPGRGTVRPAMTTAGHLRKSP